MAIRVNFALSDQKTDQNISNLFNSCVYFDADARRRNPQA